MNERAQHFWNRYQAEEANKKKIKLKIEELEAQLSYHETLSEIFYQEYDKEIMKND